MSLEFSAIIPLYNKGPHVERALRSAQRSDDGQLVEIIVVDDGSTDEGPEIVERLARDDPRIVLVRQANRGVSAARNRGTDIARSPYVLFLDADDEWTDAFLPTVISLVERFPECAAFATAYTWQWPGKPRLKLRFYAVPEDPDGGILPCYFESSAGGAGPVWVSAVCLSRAALLEAGGFPIHMKRSEDRVLWARMALLGHQFAWHPAIGAIQHWGTVNQSFATQWRPETACHYIEELTPHLERDDLPNSMRHGIRKVIALEHMNVMAAALRSREISLAGREALWLFRAEGFMRTTGRMLRMFTPTSVKDLVKRALFRESIYHTRH